MTGEKMYAAV